MDPTTTISDSDHRFAIQPYDPVPAVSVASTSLELSVVDFTDDVANKNPRRKKRTKVTNRPLSLTKPTEFKKKRKKAEPRSGSSPPRSPARPEITMPCSECGKRFWSWKALFGHMRCHPERHWRGINPPSTTTNTNLRLRQPLPLPPPPLPPPPPPPPSSSDDDDFEAAASLLLLASSGDDHYECSSCKKVFGSHQALGGHRASHKNVKGCFAMAAAAAATETVLEDRVDGTPSSVVSAVAVAEHRCGICLRIFSSGQALGGHKRCHWERSVEPPLTSSSSVVRGLDLNLPPNNEDDCNYNCHHSPSIDLDLKLGF